MVTASLITNTTPAAGQETPTPEQTTHHTTDTALAESEELQTPLTIEPQPTPETPAPLPSNNPEASTTTIAPQPQTPASAPKPTNTPQSTLETVTQPTLDEKTTTQPTTIENPTTQHPEEGQSVEAPILIHPNDPQNAATPGDNDTDGLPDEWETHGITLNNGTKMPLQHWGADPNKKDLYLQINWMEPEWKTLGCDNPDTYTENCETAKTKTYRPDTQTLNDLVNLFSDHNINLRIDAGETYTNIPNYTTRYGGETLNYQRYYFNEEEPSAVTLINTSDLLLDEREKVFHVCVIGDQMYPGDYSSGKGMINGNAFFVANTSRMNGQEDLRNTILHELGHNLGLRHSGPHQYVTNLATQNRNADYKSVMNYQYQWDTFNYSENPYTALDNKGNALRIPADWESLDFTNFLKGEGDVTLGANLNQEDKELSKTNRATQDLLIDKEKENNTAEISKIVTEKTPNGENNVTLTLKNLGLDLAKFTISIISGQGVITDTVTLGNDETTDTKTFRYPVGNSAEDINIEIRNNSGFRTTHTIKAKTPSSTPPKPTPTTTSMQKPSPTPQTQTPTPKPAQPSKPLAPAIKEEKSPNKLAITVGVISAISGIALALFWFKSFFR